MYKNIFYLMLAISLAHGLRPLAASTSVTTVPDGMIVLNLSKGKLNLLSIPLTKQPSYTGSVNSCNAATLTVDDSPAPFGFNYAALGSPHFVKFTSGNEAGRVLLILANTSNGLTLDITDHSTGAAVPLTTAGFDVRQGDTFEIFLGDTLGSVFGTGSTLSPLVLTGGIAYTTSDLVAIYGAGGIRAVSYYFNTRVGYWEQVGTTLNANNVVIYPYSALAVTRRPTHPDTTLVLMGRITSVACAIKTAGLVAVYTSTHYATDIKLSQLDFGANWLRGTTFATSDALSVWNSTLARFETFYQKTDLTWRKYGDLITDQSNFAITAGTVTTVAKRRLATGASAFLVGALPYSLK